MVIYDGKIRTRTMKYREFKLKSAECDRIRNDIKKYITTEMNGLDIGSNGSPLYIQSISLDLKKECGYGNLVQLKGDARNLHWFRDSVLDYVFSSHCLEDLLPNAKLIALREWIRVTRNNGYIVLYLPNEKKYRRFCEKTGNGRNLRHKDEDFDMDKMVDIINKNFPNQLVEVHRKEYEPYNFLLVYKKRQV